MMNEHAVYHLLVTICVTVSVMQLTAGMLKLAAQVAKSLQVWKIQQLSFQERSSHQCLIGQSGLVLQLEKSSFHLFFCSFCFLPHLFFPGQDLTLHLDEGQESQLR